MSPRAGTSSPAPHKTVGRRDNHPRSITHSQKGLQHLTKVAVDRAYKLHTESCRLVRIVETQRCGGGDSTPLGCSHPFFSLSSALLKTSSSTAPPCSKNWALSKDSKDRRSVAAKIHTLLYQWRADASSEWRSRVASVVPVLEEVLYKEAKSQEEYTNPNLLESQLMNVLCHFKAGNGPFLLQGSSPRYPVRACGPASSSSKGTSPIYQHISGQAGMSGNGDSHEIVSEETQHERATLTCTQSPVSSASSPVSTRAVPNGSESNDSRVQRNHSRKMSTDKRGRSHTSRRVVKKVVAMLSKRRNEKGECSKQGLGRDDQGAEQVESFCFHSEIEAMDRVEANNDGATRDQSSANSCRRKERMRSTLGGIFKLDMFSMKSSSAISAEAADLSSLSSTNNETAHNGVHKSEAFSDQAYIADAGRLSYAHSSMASTPSPRTSSASASASTASASMPGILMSYSPSSSAQFSSASTPSPLRLVQPHQAPFVLPVQSSPSPPQDHFMRTSIASLKPKPQHQSSSSPPQLARFSTSSDVPSVELNYAQPRMCKVHQNGTPSDNSRANALRRACRGKEQATQVFAFQQSITQTASEGPREIGQRGESSSTFSTRSSPSASHEEVPRTSLEKKVKLPLRSFLAEREEYRGCKSSYVAGGPWDTWEEATERLDGMCCVCMVGLKGAAFIPCGHTFCRKCSRELWRGRGTCPLCNRYIREILDIY